MNEHQFFYYLLNKTKVTLESNFPQHKRPFTVCSYAICDTPILKNAGIIFGLNWGGSNPPQTTYPTTNRSRNWNFIASSQNLILKYLGTDVNELNYSNLCFFRSKKVSELAPEHWNLAIPLFKEYVEYINPPWLLMLGKPMRNDLLQIQPLVKHTVVDNKFNRRTFGYTGNLFNKYPFASVPHPQARISSASREEIWLKVIIDNSNFPH